jgi:N-acetylglucosaminyldiphosphoundecaprenol N-acetyl-beta-D-mannosaminyltransferase
VSAPLSRHPVGAPPPAFGAERREPGLHAGSYRILGVEVQGLGSPGLCHLLDQAISAGGPRIIGNHNLHSVYLYHRDPAMRRFCDLAQTAFIDGMSLVWVGRLLGLAVTPAERVTAVDWLRPVLAHARDRAWRVFFLGSARGVADRAADVFRRELPGLRLAVHHGYFDTDRGSAENESVLTRIREFAPHLLIVGMGMPRQERWIVDNLDAIHAGVIMNQGAFMDFVAGVVPTPPRWLARMGFEWLARLAAEPRRMWRRYLVEPWTLLPLLIRDLHRYRLRMR